MLNRLDLLVLLNNLILNNLPDILIKLYPIFSPFLNSVPIPDLIKQIILIIQLLAITIFQQYESLIILVLITYHYLLIFDLINNRPNILVISNQPILHHFFQIFLIIFFSQLFLSFLKSQLLIYLQHPLLDLELAELIIIFDLDHLHELVINILLSNIET